MSKQRIIQAAKENNSVITASWCRESGIPSIYLSRLVDEKVLYRSSRGIYTLNEHDADPWFILQTRNPICIFSFVSSLYLLDATDIIPNNLEVTVYAGYNASHFPKDTIVHYVNKNILQLGVMTIKTRYGNEVRCYDMERTICDFISNRTKIDSELYSTTLQKYSSSPQQNIRRLMQYAAEMGIRQRVQKTMEVLV